MRLNVALRVRLGFVSEAERRMARRSLNARSSASSSSVSLRSRTMLGRANLTCPRFRGPRVMWKN